MNLEALAERLKAHSQYFDDVLALIPPKYYFPQEVNEEPRNKYMYNTKGKPPKQEIKEHSKKVKKTRLDPNQYHTVIDIQKQQIEKSENKGDDASEITEPDDQITTTITKEEKNKNLQEKLQKKVKERIKQKRKADAMVENNESEPLNVSNQPAKKAKKQKENNLKMNGNASDSDNEPEITFGNIELDEKQKKKITDKRKLLKIVEEKKT